MSEAATFKRAVFTHQSGKAKGKKAGSLDVHFNPESLQLSLNNTVKKTGKGNSSKQYVSQSTAKLTMDLVFDTTHSGEDVRTRTKKVAEFMKPEKKSGLKGQGIPPIVLFEWGTFKFQGMAEGYKETIEFFSPDGVPLRASINLTLANQDKVFEDGGKAARANLPAGTLTPDEVQVPTRQGPTSEQVSQVGGGAPADGGGRSPAQVAARAGDSRAARAIAAANGEESLRFSTGRSLVVSPSIATRGASALAGGVAGSLQLGANSTAGAVRSIGGRASARLAANAGAFAGLRAGNGAGKAASLDVDRLLDFSESAEVAGDRDASFALGGQALLEGSASLTADVGVSASLRPRIQFDQE